MNAGAKATHAHSLNRGMGISARVCWHGRMKFLISLLLALVTPVFAEEKPEPPKPVSHTEREIEGWKVRVDDRLLNGDGKALGERTLKLLECRLYEITLVLPADKVQRLREVPIQLDLTHGKLHPAQYHPSAGWLRSNGYDEKLARCVHIPDAAAYVSDEHQRIQPWSVLHELAHAFHDQVLGFENAEIQAVWEKFRDSGKYGRVLHTSGKQREHYALTNAKEFFAEMTEAYFGVNDFFPFNRAELQREEPEVYALIGKMWGAGK
jgi:hypothetical protein